MALAAARPDRRIVLHVTECVGGGVPAVIRALVNNVSDVTHVVYWPAENGHLDSRAHVVEMPRGLFSRLRTLRRVLRLSGADIVHAHSSWGGVLSRLSPATKVVYQPHAFAFEGVGGRLQRRAYRLVEKVLSWRTSAYVVVSPHEGRLATELSSRVPVQFVPNSSAYRPGQLVPASHSRRYVAMAGRIAEQKDPSLFARIARTFRARDSEIDFVWIGDGDPVLRRVLEEAEVAVTGWLPAIDAARIIAGATLYLHTASYEGFPLAILDAISLGVPVLARRIPAYDGLDLRTFAGLDGAVATVAAAMEDDRWRGSTLAAQAEISLKMNADEQASAASELYRVYA